MSSIAESMFAGIANAKESFEANYFRAGHYLWVIDAIKADKNRKGVPFMAVECTCLHVYDDNDGQGHKVGESASWLITADKDSFLGNVKSFVAKTLDVSADKVTKDACVALCSEAQPLAGWFVESQNRMITTQAGKLFTKVGWKGRVPDELVQRVCDPEVLARLFPEGLEGSDEE